MGVNVLRVKQSAGNSNCFAKSFDRLVCHSDRREESKMPGPCQFPVPAETPLLSEFRFLAPLGMTD